MFAPAFILFAFIALAERERERAASVNSTRQFRQFNIMLRALACSRIRSSAYSIIYGGTGWVAFCGCVVAGEQIQKNETEGTYDARLRGGFNSI